MMGSEQRGAKKRKAGPMGGAQGGLLEIKEPFSKIGAKQALTERGGGGETGGG